MKRRREHHIQRTRADRAIDWLIEAGVDPDLLSALLQFSSQMVNGRLQGIPVRHLMALAEYERRSNEYHAVLQDMVATFAGIATTAMHLERGGDARVSAKILSDTSTELAKLQDRWSFAYRQLQSWNREIDPDNLPEDCITDINNVKGLIDTHREAVQRLMAGDKGEELIRVLNEEYSGSKEILKRLQSIDKGGRRSREKWRDDVAHRMLGCLEKHPAMPIHTLYNAVRGQYRNMEIAKTLESDKVAEKAYEQLRHWEESNRQLEYLKDLYKDYTGVPWSKRFLR